jgi:hypothetical protein
MAQCKKHAKSSASIISSNGRRLTFKRISALFWFDFKSGKTFKKVSAQGLVKSISSANPRTHARAQEASTRD